VTFLVCLAQLRKDGKIDRERHDRFAREYQRLHQSYAKQVGDIAAEDLASRDAMDALEYQALTDRRQKMMQIRTQQALLTKVQGLVEAGKPIKHIVSALMDHHENVPGLQSVDNTRGAIRQLAWSRMGEFLQRHGRDILGRARDQAELDDVVRALRGEAVESESAREMAAAISDTMEWLRQQFNAAGGAIPKLENWALPQSHDAMAIAKAGYAEWRDFILPMLDWTQMRDSATGKAFTSVDALEPALEQAWRNISSNGLDNAVPGAFSGKGKMANRHTDHRFFVFKSADDWMAYNDRFGVGHVFDAVAGHIESMSRDIAAMRVLGPSPDATVRWLGDALRQHSMPTIEAGKSIALQKDAGRAAKILTDQWDYYSGELTRVAPENRTTARFFSGVRNWNVMSKMGNAGIAAVMTDPMFMGLTAKFNGLPVMEQIGTYLRSFNPVDSSHREAAMHAGLVFAEMTGRAEQMWRDGQFNMHEFTRRGANALMDTTLLTPHTMAAKLSVGLSFMKDWAEHADTAFHDLGGANQMALERYGIDSRDWDALRAVGAVEQGGLRLLRPADLARTGDAAALESAVKFMSLIDSETKFAVPGESLRAQAWVATGGHSTRVERGTIGGELIHSATQFKTYSVIWMMTQLERAVYGRGGMSKIGYAVSLPIFLTLGGYVADTLIDLAKGEKPSMELTKLRLGRAIVRGGGLGIMGDIAGQAAASDGPRSAGVVAGMVTGPTVGSIIDPVTAIVGGNIGDAVEGNETHVGSEVVRQLRQTVPGSNAWYARVAMNRLVLDRLQMLADPNYAQSWARMERAAQARGSTYWWAPGQPTPDFATSRPGGNAQ